MNNPGVDWLCLVYGKTYYTYCDLSNFLFRCFVPLYSPLFFCRDKGTIIMNMFCWGGVAARPVLVDKRRGSSSGPYLPARGLKSSCGIIVVQ